MFHCGTFLPVTWPETRSPYWRKNSSMACPKLKSCKWMECNIFAQFEFNRHIYFRPSRTHTQKHAAWWSTAQFVKLRHIRSSVWGESLCIRCKLLAILSTQKKVPNMKNQPSFEIFIRFFLFFCSSLQSRCVAMCTKHCTYAIVFWRYLDQNKVERLPEYLFPPNNRLNVL